MQTGHHPGRYSSWSLAIVVHDMKSYKTAKKFDRNDDERKSNVKNKKNEREGVNTQMVVSKLAVLKVSQVFVVDFL